MSFYKVAAEEATFRDMFNEEHSLIVIKELLGQNLHGKKLRLTNCGVRIMKEMFASLFESGVTAVDVHYDWDLIMANPKLVSWDKLTWKTIQQINNWNKVWNELFTPLRDVKEVSLWLRCSWLNKDFLKAVLESLISMPFLSKCELYVEARDVKLADLLASYKQAKLVPGFSYQFQEWRPNQQQ